MFLVGIYLMGGFFNEVLLKAIVFCSILHRWRLFLFISLSCCFVVLFCFGNLPCTRSQACDQNPPRKIDMTLAALFLFLSVIWGITFQVGIPVKFTMRTPSPGFFRLSTPQQSEASPEVGIVSFAVALLFCQKLKSQAKCFDFPSKCTKHLSVSVDPVFVKRGGF